MNNTDNLIRDALIESCRCRGIDVEALSIEVFAGLLNIHGTVPTEDQRHRLWSLLETVDRSVNDIVCRVRIRPVEAPTVPASVATSVVTTAAGLPLAARIAGNQA